VSGFVPSTVDIVNSASLNAPDTNLNLARVAYLGIPNFRINAGVIQPIMTYGDTVSSGQLMFLERSEINNIATDSYGGSDARRGIELTFQKADLLMPGDNLIISGAFTGNKTGDQTGHGTGGDENTQVVGRIAYRLWSDGTSNIQIGGSGADILHRSPTSQGLQLRDRPELRVDGTRLIDTGSLAATGGYYWGADAEMNWQNFYLGGEYAKFSIDRTNGTTPTFSGWYTEGSWVLTGETKAYGVSATNNEYGSWGIPAPSRPFSLKGNSWGAWELAARYSDTDLNWEENTSGTGVAGGDEKIWTVGLNWYLNRNVRMMFDYLNVSVDRLAAPGSTTQVGQDFNALGYRLQFQF
jgi:phosphate-selective porin OprO/OprP